MDGTDDASAVGSVGGHKQLTASLQDLNLAEESCSAEGHSLTLGQPASNDWGMQQDKGLASLGSAWGSSHEPLQLQSASGMRLAEGPASTLGKFNLSVCPVLLPAFPPR